MVESERKWMLDKLKRYKKTLEEREINLMQELSRYQESTSLSNDDEVLGDFKDIELDIYTNSHETYLLTQIKIVKALPALLEKHMECLKKGNDLDLVIDSLEFQIYKVKKKVYVNIREWEDLLNYLSDQRLLEIENNPKGPGDMIIRELCWLRDYENRWR